MFLSKDQPEEKLQNNERKIEELSIQFEALDREIHGLLQELNVTPEQLTQFVNTKQNFTDENWDQLQEEHKKMQEKLQVELQNIRNPQQMKKRYAERFVGNNWLFVR